MRLSTADFSSDSNSSSDEDDCDLDKLSEGDDDAFDEEVLDKNKQEHLNKEINNESKKSLVNLDNMDSQSEHEDSQNEHKDSKTEQINTINLKNLLYEQVINILFEEDAVNHLPKQTDKESYFCIDLNVFSLKDALADDTGGYEQYGNRSKYFRIEENINGLNISPFGKKKSKSLTQSTLANYGAQKKFYTSLSNRQFKRKTIRLTKLDKPKEFDKLFMCYYWDNESNNNVLNLKVISSYSFFLLNININIAYFSLMATLEYTILLIIV